MKVSRRNMLVGAGLTAAFPAGRATPVTRRGPFAFEGVYLDAAFTHPLGTFACDAAVRYAGVRRAAAQAVGPRANPRGDAVRRFATLIGADPVDIAVVPSTLEAENCVNAALSIGPGAGVVTDALHYDGALALYDYLARQGVPITVARPGRDGGVALDDLRAAITPDTRLIAVSLVSSTTGFTHDLAKLCAMAHERGVLVYADAVQAAGAIPIDVKASGVDFVGCGTYKWLMGDYGSAFLYVRPDRIDRLKRVQVGWRQILSHSPHALPYDTPGPAIGDFKLAEDAAGLFEVSTPAWGTLAVVSASLDYLLGVGVEALARRRAPLIAQLQADLPRLGLQPLTPTGTTGPVVSFALRGAESRLGPALRAAGIQVSTYPNRIRVSPSVYNTGDDIALLVDVIGSALRRSA